MIVFFDIFGKMVWKDVCLFYAEVGMSYIQNMYFISLSAGQMSIRIIFPDSVFKNPIIFIFYKYVLFMDKIVVFLTLELSELIFHVNCWNSSLSAGIYKNSIISSDSVFVNYMLMRDCQKNDQNETY